MPRNRLQEADYRALAHEFSIPASEIKRAVNSFFGVIVKEARELKLDNERRIYGKSRFEEFGTVRNIPRIGRLGPSYSRYLKWRANEAKRLEQKDRSNYKSRYFASDLERFADDVLSGRKPEPLKKRRSKELYDRIWLVDKYGKRLARQVIPKNEDKLCLISKE